MMNLQEFRRYRDESARREITARLPRLRALLAWRALAVIAQATQQAAEQKRLYVRLRNVDPTERKRQMDRLVEEHRNDYCPVWAAYFDVHTEIHTAEAHLDWLNRQAEQRKRAAVGLFGSLFDALTREGVETA